MFFNDVSDRIVVASGSLAAVGYAAGGVIGAIAGLALGLASTAGFMKTGRFFRD